MVDNLRRAVEQLEPPECQICRREMRWVRSTLVASSPLTIDHVFQCTNCNRLATTQSKPNNSDRFPGKLSAPLTYGLVGTFTQINRSTSQEIRPDVCADGDGCLRPDIC